MTAKRVMFDSKSCTASCSTSRPNTSAARRDASAAAPASVCSATSFAPPAVSYTASTVTPRPFRYFSHCASACGCEYTTFTSSMLRAGQRLQAVHHGISTSPVIGRSCSSSRS